MTDRISRLATVCALLNSEDVRYVIVGGYAVALHGYARATQDVDVLLDPELANVERALHALSQLPFNVAGDLIAERVAASPVTIIGDTPNVDLLTIAWSVRYADAAPTMLWREIQGIRVPFVDIDTLIRSKRTGRGKDLGDIEELEEIKKLTQE